MDAVLYITTFIITLIPFSVSIKYLLFITIKWFFYNIWLGAADIILCMLNIDIVKLVLCDSSREERNMVT